MKLEEQIKKQRKQVKALSKEKYTKAQWNWKTEKDNSGQDWQYNWEKKKLTTVVEGYQKAPFSIATTLWCRGGRYSFPWIAPLYSWYVPYIAEC